MLTITDRAVGVQHCIYLSVELLRMITALWLGGDGTDAWYALPALAVDTHNIGVSASPDGTFMVTLVPGKRF